MPSTYTLNNGIELIGTGEQSGSWGDTTNTNFELIDTALDGQVTVTLASAGTSGSPNALPISDGASSNGRNRMIIFNDGADLGATAYVQLTPNDAEKIVYIRNALSGSRSIIVFQGTYNASNDYEIPAGTTAVIYFNGGGAGAVAANVFNNAYFDSLRLGGVSVTAIIDDDTMATAAATNIPTAESVKAYVDAQVGANNELSEVLANGNTTGGTSISVNSTDNILFGDNNKAIFGAGSDLQIYHDGSSRIANTTGNLIISDTDGDIYIQAKAGENSIRANNDGSVQLYFDDALKFNTTSTGIDVTGVITADDYIQVTGSPSPYIELVDTDNSVTTRLQSLNTSATVGTESNHDFYIQRNNTNIVSVLSTGIDVTGTVTADGLTVDGTDTEATTSQLLKIRNSTTGEAVTIGLYAKADNGGDGNTGSITFDAGADGSASNNALRFSADHQTDTNPALSIAGNRDISFYEDTGTTPKFFWDASAETVNIGDIPVAIDGLLAVRSNANSHAITIYEPVGANENWQLGVDVDGDLGFYNSGSTTASVTFDDAGNVGIGTTSPSYLIDAQTSSGNAQVQIKAGGDLAQLILTSTVTTGNSQINFADADSSNVGMLQYFHSDNHMEFTVNSAERLRIEADGDILFGSSTNYAWMRPYEASTGNLIISADNGGTGTNGSAIKFRTRGADKMIIEHSGNVGIGTSSPYKSLTVGDTDATAWITSGGSNVHLTVSPNGASGSFIVRTGGTNGDPSTTTERMRIDSSGNLLVGTTNNTSSTAGFKWRQDLSRLITVADGGSPASFGRLTSDGDIALFQKDGTTVGSIGADGGDVYIGTGDTAIIFSDGNDAIVPFNTTAGTFRGSAIDLGYLTYPFKDLYLSGQTLVTSGAASAPSYSFIGDTNTGISRPTSDAVNIVTAGSERMRIDASGNVGIGDSTPSQKLDVNGNIRVTSGFVEFAGDTSTPAAAAAIHRPADNTLAFSTLNTERMRIDASGNLLVGKTSANYTTAGVMAEGDGTISSVKAGVTGVFNRLTSDGDIVQFRKDGTTVGSIGSISGDTYIQTGGYGIRFSDAAQAIRPSDSTGGANATMDIGDATVPWRNLYLSGGVYLGGTGAANLLDDYEEGTHQVTVTPSISGTVTLGASYDDAAYTKVGRLVNVTGGLDVTSISSPSGYLIVSLPFQVATGSQASRSSAAVTVYNTTGANTSDFTSLLVNGESAMRIYLGDATSLQNDSAEAMTSTSRIVFSVTYVTN